MVVLESSPPLALHYNDILRRWSVTTTCREVVHEEELQELPVIDLGGLSNNVGVYASEIVRASSEWGFFQVVNHGISTQLFGRMRREQMQLFNAPFSRKSTCGLLNNSYRWGSPTAASPDYFSWSEAFHVPLTKISDHACYGEFSSLRQVLMEYAAEMQKLAKLLAEVLITNLGQTVEEFKERISCDESTCFLRMNRYPPCPLSPEIYGLVPHTDSDFLTILHQDQVGGLQLIKDSKWVAVKPNKDALIVNIGDLFQAWSNDLYKSVEHKVMANPKTERFSVAYFLCPSYDSLIRGCRQPCVYRDFTFGEYRSKVQDDSKIFGRKIGLPRFRL